MYCVLSCILRPVIWCWFQKTAHCKDKDSGDSCVTTLRLFAHSAVPSGDLFQISEERSSDEEEEEEDYYYSDEN